MTTLITNSIVDKSSLAGEVLPEVPVYISTLVLTKLGPQPNWMKLSVSGISLDMGASPVGETYRLRSVELLERMYQTMVEFYFRRK